MWLLSYVALTKPDYISVSQFLQSRLENINNQVIQMQYVFVANQSAVCGEGSDNALTHSLSKLCEQPLKQGVKDSKSSVIQKVCGLIFCYKFIQILISVDSSGDIFYHIPEWLPRTKRLFENRKQRPTTAQGVLRCLQSGEESSF